MGIVRLSVALTACGCAPSFPMENARTEAIPTDAARAIEAAVSPMLERCPDGALAVVGNDRVVYRNAWGTEDGLKHRYEWGSVSKVVTALIALRMVEEERFTLDRPVWELAPKYEALVPQTRRTPPLTLALLLSHTGGLTHKDYRDTEKMFMKSRGTYRYSSNGFGVVGDVLRSVSGETYPALVGKYIDDKLEDTKITAARDTFVAPAALVTSNISDFGAFAVGVMGDAFVSRASLEAIQTPRTLLPEPQGPGGWFTLGLRPTAYGYGVELAPGAATPTFGHSGKNGRKRAFLMLRPAQRRGFAAFCTAQGESPHWWRIAENAVDALPK